LIKIVDRYPYIKFSNGNRKKVQYIVNILVIFTILFTLVLVPATSSWNVYGQPNETDSQTENVIQSIPHTSQEGITESTNEQHTSETGSSENSSDIINDEQDIAGGSIHLVDLLIHNLMGIVCLTHHYPNVLLMKMVIVLKALI